MYQPSKILISLAFILILCLTLQAGILSASDDFPSHNITWGARSGRDVLLNRTIVVEHAKFLRIVSNDFEFRQPANRARTITSIVVTDQYVNGDGGYATLYSGGPGNDFVIIHLRSQRGHGYNFIIDIYGQ